MYVGLALGTQNVRRNVQSCQGHDLYGAALVFESVPCTAAMPAQHGFCIVRSNVNSLRTKTRPPLDPVTVASIHRSLRPAQDAASVLQRYRQEHPGSKIGPLEASHGGPAPDGEDSDHQGIPPGSKACRSRLKLDSSWTLLPAVTLLNEEMADFRQQCHC